MATYQERLAELNADWDHAHPPRRFHVLPKWWMPADAAQEVAMLATVAGMTPDGTVDAVLDMVSLHRSGPSRVCEFEQSECDECTAGRPQHCLRM